MSKAEVISSIRAAFGSGKTLEVSFREQQLQNLLRMYEECEGEFVDAMQRDLRRSKMEATMEIEIMKEGVRGTLRNLKTWLSPRKIRKNALKWTDSAFIQREPYGVTLIISTWNFPFVTLSFPLVGAIAAGNCAVIKPSEVSAHSSALIARLYPLYLDSECYKVVEGDVGDALELLSFKFDYIFATGSCVMGKSVLTFAAKHLTPVALEMGGKSPVYIDDNVDMDQAVKRILWAKCMNVGQVCVSPDYLLISKKRQDEFVDIAKRVLDEWYGKEWNQSDDLGRIINSKHFHRLKNLLDTTKGRIAVGGDMDEKNLWISPTLVVDMDPNTDVMMQEEIFGPILAIIQADTSDAALSFITERPKPLALYVFSDDQTTIDKFIQKSSSGSICVNDVLYQTMTDGLPLGGVGNSGMGRCTGEYSVEAFSHEKPILIRSLPTSKWIQKMEALRFPPYSNAKSKFTITIIKNLHRFELSASPYVTHSLALLLGLMTAYWAF